MWYKAVYSRTYIHRKIQDLFLISTTPTEEKHNTHRCKKNFLANWDFSSYLARRNDVTKFANVSVRPMTYVLNTLCSRTPNENYMYLIVITVGACISTIAGFKLMLHYLLVDQMYCMFQTQQWHQCLVHLPKQQCPK